MESRGKHVDKKSHSKAKHREQKRDKFKKFIGNKSEGQGFADKRKRKIQYEYMKMLKKEKQKHPASTVQPTIEDSPDITETSNKPKKHHQKQTSKQNFGRSTFSKAAEEAETRKGLKKKKKDEALGRKQERESALNQYQTKKKETFKKICKKTHKGQPVMKNQIEYLLQKIEQQRNQT